MMTCAAWAPCCGHHGPLLDGAMANEWSAPVLRFLKCDVLMRALDGQDRTRRR